MAESMGPRGPSSKLRPFQASTDELAVPQLIYDSQCSNIALSNSHFLVSPHVVAIFMASTSAGLYKLWQIYSSSGHHQMWDPQLYATLIRQGGWASWRWQDYIELVIYAMPIIAAIVGILYGSAYWYHTRLWRTLALDEVRGVDVRDVEGYYYPQRMPNLLKESPNATTTNSSFWCLEYDHQIVACFGLDARNPGRTIKRLTDKESPRPALQYKEDVPTAPIDKKRSKMSNEELDEQDDKLIDFLQEQAKPTENGMNGRDEAAFSSSAYQPASKMNVLPAVFDNLQGQVVHLRHVSISPNFKSASTASTKATQGALALTKISTYVLTLAIEAAFSASAGQANGSGKARIQKLVIELDPKLEKGLRAAALDRGFIIVGTSQPIADMLTRQKRTGWRGVVENALARIWPLDFHREMLVLDRAVWEKNRPKAAL